MKGKTPKSCHLPSRPPDVRPVPCAACQAKAAPRHQNVKSPPRENPLYGLSGLRPSKYTILTRPD